MPELTVDWSAFDQLITDWMDSAQTPALAVIFFDCKQIIRGVDYGVTDRESRNPVTADTLFEIGSITKTFTAVAVMQAIERGSLDLDGAVTDYLPWFEVQNQVEPIRIRHLLSHTAGLVGVIDEPPDIRGAVWAVRNTELAWRPGSRFAYSDTGYQILTLILQEVMGKPFSEIIRENIFEPLAMTHSEAALTHALRPQLAMGYQPLYDDRPANQPLVPARWVESSSGDCCIASTADDMARFGQMLLNRGQGVLSAESFEAMSQPYSPLESMDYGQGTVSFEYGYGLMLRHEEGFRHMGHAGGMPGYAAELILDVDNGLGVAILCARPQPRKLFWKLMSLWRKLYQGQVIDWLDIQPINRYHIDKAGDFAGTFRRGEEELVLVAEQDRVFLDHGGNLIALEARGENAFYVDHPDFALFLLRFARHENNDAIAEAFFGSDCYIEESYIGRTKFAYPTEWEAYVGHYRSHNPWQTNFRVIMRKNVLLLVSPDGDEKPLIALRENEFYVGEPPTPERIKFDQIASGQALRAILSGCSYYRFFTP